MLRSILRSLCWVIFPVMLPVSAAVTVAISPKTITLNQGATAAFNATVSGSTNKAVTWSVRGTGNGTVTTAGVYTAPAKAGSFKVRATSKARTTKYAEATVTVAAPVAVSISPITAALSTGGTQQFSATVTGTTNTAVTWTTTGGTISTGGLFTAPSTMGTYAITAKSTADPTKTATATLTVVAPVSVSITPTTATLTVSRGMKFGYSISGASSTTVTWSVLEAGGGTVDASGNYTAPAAPGTYTVRVASVADATKTAQSKVTVVSAPDGTLTAPASVNAGATGLQASVPTQAGATYAWSIVGGTLATGQTSSTVSFKAGTGSSLTLSCKVTNGAGDSITSSKTVAIQGIVVTVSPANVALTTGAT